MSIISAGRPALLGAALYAPPAYRLGAAATPPWYYPGNAAALSGRLVLFAELAEFVGKLRQCLEQIRHQAVIGHLEDRRLLVLVDRHNDLGVLHAGEMLNGA